MSSFTRYNCPVFLVLTILICFSTGRLIAEKNKTDSLIKAVKSGKEDTSKVKALNILAYALKNNNPDTGIILANQGLQLAEKLHWEKGIGMSARSLGACNRLKGNFNEALDYYFLSLQKYTTINDKAGIATVLGNIGVVYKNMANYPKALEYEFKALNMAEELKDKEESARHKANIGLVFLNQEDFEKAIEYLEKALVLFREIKDKDGVANCLGSIGSIYGTMGSRAVTKGDYEKATTEYFQKALNYYEEALKLVIEMGELRDVALYYDNIAVVTKDLGKIAAEAEEKSRLFSVSLDYHKKALSINEKIDNTIAIAENHNNIGVLYKEMSMTINGAGQKAKLMEAESHLKKAETIYKIIGALNYLAITEGVLSEVYSGLGMDQKAYDHYVDHIHLKDTLFNEENKKKTLRAEMNFEFDKKQAIAKAEEEKKEAIAKAEREKEKQKNKIIFTSVLAGFCLVLVFSGFVLRSYNQKKKINILITSQKQETEKQKLLIEEKQKEILDSIHYAKRIQTALLTNEKYIARTLQNLKP
ncbi:MAG: tetratricopeptide repeat protein [Bacteroidia bacterium]